MVRAYGNMRSCAWPYEHATLDFCQQNKFPLDIFENAQIWLTANNDYMPLRKDKMNGEVRTWRNAEMHKPGQWSLRAGKNYKKTVSKKSTKGHRYRGQVRPSLTERRAAYTISLKPQAILKYCYWHEEKWFHQLMQWYKKTESSH